VVTPEAAAAAQLARRRAIERLSAGGRRELLQALALLCPDEFDRTAVALLAPPAGPRLAEVLVEMFREMGRPDD
jgi:hypothetical protein